MNDLIEKLAQKNGINPEPPLKEQVAELKRENEELKSVLLLLLRSETNDADDNISLTKTEVV